MPTKPSADSLFQAYRTVMRECFAGYSKYKFIAVGVAGVWVMALLMALSMPALAFALGDTEWDHPPHWMEIIFSTVWYASMFVAAYPIVVLACSPFWLLGQHILKKSGRASASRYLNAIILGWSAGLLVCFSITLFGPENKALSKTYQAAANSVIPYVEGKSHLNKYESHRRLIDPLFQKGQMIVMLIRFLDSFGYCILTGVLLPPFALYMWDRHKRSET